MDNDTVNYIVSGLERSGTSLMMQILHAGGMPVGSDDSRPPDEHNPRGYYELAGGKIINRLMEGSFDLAGYRGQVIKVTAYGLKFLPPGNYRIIYMIRDLEEVLKSMQKMGAEVEPKRDRVLYEKLNKFCLALMRDRPDMEYLTVNYADIIANPREEIERIRAFLNVPLDVKSAMGAVDASLYRNRAREQGAK